jgi:hypothetical protein
MSRRMQQVGFSQRIRLEWFEYTARLILAGHDPQAMHDALDELLRDKLSAGAAPERGNREKTISILLKVWQKVPHGLEGQRDSGLDLLRRLPSDDSSPVHWGMVMSVYPFWAAVASQVGRLTRLQGNASAAQVQRRIREQYGERETVSRAASRVLRTFFDWGVLRDTETVGVYEATGARSIQDDELIAWLVEAGIHARGGSPAPWKDLVNSPALFPFQLRPTRSATALLSSSKTLQILRHGLDDELVMLRQ